MWNIALRFWQNVRRNKLTYFWLVFATSQLALNGRYALVFLRDVYEHWGDASRADAAVAKSRCDKVVGNLLTTMDPVEIQRDGVILQHLDCSISDRLPK